MSYNKTLVIGIDSASWNIITPLIAKGKLRTFNRLLHSGVAGNLESIHPYITSPAWKCYSSGKNPGKLGVFGWYDFHIAKKKLKMANSTTFKSKEIWDYLGEYGFKCGIINMPQTYPPKKINGFMISGSPAPNDLEYTYPPELKEILKKYGYYINPNYDLSADKEKGLTEIEYLIKKRFSVARHALKNDDIAFLHTTLFFIDNIHHYFWGKMQDGDEIYGDVIEDFWELIDIELDKTIKDLDGYNIIIMSDHGSRSLEGQLYINNWLIEEGYLHLNGNTPKIYSILLRSGLTKERLSRLIKKLKLDHIILKLIPFDVLFKIQTTLITEKGDEGVASIINKVDWDKTTAISVGEQCIYLNIEKDDVKYETIRNGLIENIKKLSNPLNGTSLVENVVKKEEIYSGEYLDIAPDLVVIPTKGYRFHDAISQNGSWDYSNSGWTGYHDPYGLFLAHGSDIKQGTTIEGARIIDLAPTILHMFGVPIPRDMDGRVLIEIFHEDSEMAQREIIYEGEKTKAEKERDALKNKIGKFKQKR